MWAFVLAALLLTAAALLFVLPPMLRRPGGATTDAGAALALSVHRERMAELEADAARGAISAQDHARERMDLERRVAEELPAAMPQSACATAGEPRWAARATWPVALAAPLMAAGLYLALGEPRTVMPAGAANTGANSAHAMAPEQMLALVDKLATRLKAQPDDADGWHMLARSYVSFARYADAALAYERAAALQPGNANLLVDYADVLAMTNNRSLEGRPMELVNAALKVEPRHGKALALAGTAAFNRKDYAAAIGHWRTLQATLAPDSEGFRRVAGSIADAQARLVGDTSGVAAAATAAPAPMPSPTPTAAAAGIQGEVALADALKARVEPGSTLFVFARAVQGPRMPLAIVRVPAGPGPVAFVLDDTQAMSPQARLSMHGEVMLGARISKSGNATPQSGDLMGTVGPVKVGTRGVRVVVDGVVP